MGKNSKCCNDDYQNLANVVSYFNFPITIDTDECAPLSSTDSLDWTISDDTLSLICQNSGVWYVSALYQLKALNIGLGLIKGYFRVNGNDLKTTMNVTTILTPDDSPYVPDKNTQQNILNISIARKFNKGDKLNFIAKSKNNSIPTATVLNIQASSNSNNPSLIVTMVKR